MKITFSLHQISQTGNIDNILILRQNKIDLMARFMEIKPVNPKLRQDQIAKELRCSSSTLQRYGQDIKTRSPYKITPNNHKRKQKISISNREHDLERPQMNSIDFKRTKLTSNEASPIKPDTSKKNKLKGGGNIEINDNYLDENLLNNKL